MRPSRTGKNEKVTLEPSIQTFDTNHHSARVNASANRFLLPGASARVRRRSAWCPVPGVTEWGLSSAVAMPARTADVICTTVVKASLHQTSLHQGRWQDGAARAPRCSGKWRDDNILRLCPCCEPRQRPGLGTSAWWGRTQTLAHKRTASHQHSTAAPFFFTQRLPPEV